MRKAAVVILAAALAGAGWWAGREWSAGRLALPEAIEGLRERAAIVGKEAAEAVGSAAKTVSAPPPLRAATESPTARLTASGAFSETNRHRAEAGLPALTRDARLDAAAKAKLDDMFARQYFAHESPSGDGPAQIVDAAGYAYIAVGENLALGNFADDRALVQAWMDSSGHRANILGEAFTQIGVAVGQGAYEGKKTWMAVQEFARPLSDCPQPDPALAGSIETNRTRIEAMSAEADARRAELEASDPKTRKEVEEHNRKVEDYNDLARRINALIEGTKRLVEDYNAQVRAFNACAAG